MGDIPFNWQLSLTVVRHNTIIGPISEFKINAQWNLVCLWSQNQPYKPEYLEFRRSSTSKEILISGTLKVMYNNMCLLQRKFAQLIEADYATTTIKVSTFNFKNLSNLCGSAFSITGTLSIPACMESQEDDKGVQFESLLDLSNDFECLLDPGATYFSDVNLNCGISSFPAHKSILSARSPVFATMFTTQMKEKQENKVNITDLSPQILKTMLSYMYTGKTGELSFQIAGELLFAADKYQIVNLKRVCCIYLKNYVSVENVLKILVLGYLHEKDLEVFAMDFICNCSEEFEVLEKTVEWKNMREKRPVLAMDILTNLVKSKDKKIKSANK